MVVSASEQGPVFETYHTGSNLVSSPNAVTEVGAETVFRIGSTSKLLTIYQLLQSGGHRLMNDLLGKYIPELDLEARSRTCGDEVEKGLWTGITVGALASHLAGIARDCNPE